MRRLAAFANVHSCPTATAAFAAGIDTDRVFAGTSYAMPFGQSPFALGRGVTFERLLLEKDCERLRRLLEEAFGHKFPPEAVINLRDGYPKDHDGLARRADDTAEALREAATSARRARVLVGAVLRHDIGGQHAFFEADEVAIGVEGRVYVGENKSWPVVDGRATDEVALGAALDQAATYLVLARRTLARFGIDGSCVANEVILVTPRNTGLSPVLHRQNVAPRIRRIERLLATVPDLKEVTSSSSSTVGFDRVADRSRSEAERLRAFIDASDALGGRVYEPSSCLTSCGFAWACRAHAFRRGDPAVVGAVVAQATVGIPTLQGVNELASGARPDSGQAPAAAIIQRAARLFDAATSVSRKGSRR